MELGPGEQVFDLVPARGYEVSGRVVEENGDPVAGATVEFRRQGAGGGRRGGWWSSSEQRQA